ncbi:hypothetical protein BK120_30210 [Paenibacillus sp. FSL A5-0031]|uniref:hypothetical protein n=1 Tax=Paenibacillus sp. FSL A5-0031 TaxID=1920420 RepID=UPI00096D2EB5|nr:hypothetical protein [Paenibacillus sp. FSL A5-0031]OME75939.1 hypothetical protein BK120_30210 [Paenibacillus sp. FSL A5-0031]
MSIDRLKLIEHLEFNAEQLRLKIDGYDEAKSIDSGMILMWVAKKIMLTHLLDDLYQGKFDAENNPLNEF